jgi:uncharacterized protein with HEPN domain
MPSREWKLRIEDIIEAIEKIRAYTAEISLETFGGDSKAVDAVIRNVEVIGEASQHLPSDIRARFPKIPWDEMRGIRNVLIHEYFGVDVEVLWETIQSDLPPLLPLLRRILAEPE